MSLCIISINSASSTVQSLVTTGITTGILNLTGNRVMTDLPLIRQVPTAGYYLSSQSIDNATITRIVLSTSYDTQGTGLSFTSGNFVNDLLGRTIMAVFSYTVGYPSGNTVGARAAWLQKTITQGVVRYAESYANVNNLSNTSLTGTAVIQMAAGDLISLWTYHNAGVGVSQSLNSGNGANGTMLQYFIL